MNMIKKASKKLRSKKGESIAEVLVALLISVVGMMIIVGMIGTSVKIILTSTNAAHEQYGKANASEIGTGAVKFVETGSVGSFEIPVVNYGASKAANNGSSSAEVYFYEPLR